MTSNRPSGQHLAWIESGGWLGLLPLLWGLYAQHPLISPWTFVALIPCVALVPLIFIHFAKAPYPSKIKAHMWLASTRVWSQSAAGLWATVLSIWLISIWAILLVEFARLLEPGLLKLTEIVQPPWRIALQTALFDPNNLLPHPAATLLLVMLIAAPSLRIRSLQGWTLGMLWSAWLFLVACTLFVILKKPLSHWLLRRSEIAWPAFSQYGVDLILLSLLVTLGLLHSKERLKGHAWRSILSAGVMMTTAAIAYVGIQSASLPNHPEMTPSLMWLLEGHFGTPGFILGWFFLYITSVMFSSLSIRPHLVQWLQILMPRRTRQAHYASALLLLVGLCLLLPSYLSWRHAAIATLPILTLYASFVTTLPHRPKPLNPWQQWTFLLSLFLCLSAVTVIIYIEPRIDRMLGLTLALCIALRFFAFFFGRHKSAKPKTTQAISNEKTNLAFRYDSDDS